MSNCGTCKHWGDSKDVGEPYRKCTAVIHDKSSYTGTFGDEFLGDEPIDDWERTKREEILAIRKHCAVVVDGSGYFAALKCREDFGCVLYAPSSASKG